MKTSLKWLSNYIDLPWDARALAENLTLAGLEVEGIETIGAIPEGVVVGEILTRSPHPNADKLSVCTATTGEGEPLQIVCGAPNCDVGNKVPLATVGTVFDGDFTIKKAKLRGVESHGMMCSARELGLGEGHDGLMILPGDAPVGQPVAEMFQSDTVIDWEITPNRPDWASHFGIAREIAAVAAISEKLRLPAVETVCARDCQATDMASVEVMDSGLCPRYTARVIRNVKIGPSPEWMQDALLSIGLRPINNVVDITNFVMMECGQPLHAFDLAELDGCQIIVRRAAEGEKMTTLDGTECTLSSENLLIADASRGVALAGVMGGANSEISETTTTVLLESAAFNSSNVRRTAKTLGFHTDSSYRFERGVGLDMVDWASQRAAALICEYAGGELAQGVIDVYPAPYQPHHVSCRVSRTNRLLGTNLKSADIAALLPRLGLELVSAEAELVTVAIPSFRLDLEREVDLIEEVARLHGLNNLPAVRPISVIGGPRSSDAYYPIEKIRDQLLGLGLSEAINYSLMSVADATNGTGINEDELIQLSNPISAENSVMRPSLMPGLLKSVAHNLAHQVSDLAMFEIGRVIVNRPGVAEEYYQGGIVLTGRRNPERYGAEREQMRDFYDMKGLLESWLSDRRVVAQIAPAQHPGFRKGATASITVEEVEVGVFGEVDDTLTQGMRLSAPLYLALIDLDALMAAPVTSATFTPLPQFPCTTRDISLLAPATLSNHDIVATIQNFKTPMLEEVALFDIFEDEAVLGKGKRALAYSLTYRDPEKTLTDKKANKIHERLKQQLAGKLPIEYR